MVIFGLVVILVEAIEHILHGEPVLTGHFFTEITMYGLVIPALGSILLEALEQLKRQRNRAVEELHHKLALSHQLLQASCWEEQVKKIVQIPGNILPAVSASLYVYNQAQEGFDQVASWDANGKQVPLNLGNPMMECQTCVHAISPTMNPFNRCQLLNENRVPNQPIGYCLPLVYRQVTLGILFFKIPPDKNIDTAQMETLVNLTPEMALALESAILERLSEGRADAVDRERKRIARNLHDTLGQNLSLLRLKMDQMSTQAAFADIAEIRNDLEQMRAQADEAYQQMRDTLAGLQPGSEQDLETALKAQAEVVAARANFTVEIKRVGKPIRLHPHVSRQVLYICREVLNNIEKHAHAQAVSIALHWCEQNLLLQLRDNGIGFNPNALMTEDSYGFTIMMERAENIQAQLTFHSAPQQGTEIVLRLPLGVENRLITT